MKIGIVLLIIVLILALVLGSSFVTRRNQMAIKREAVNAYGEIAAARAALLGAKNPAEKIAANSQLDSALGRLLVVVENYPQLKSNENFMRLQDELAGTENRIAIERRRYNEVVQDYNTYISLFPNNIVASLSGFTRNDAYFKTEPGARQVPKVDFDYGKTPGASTTPAPAPPPKSEPTPAPAHP